MRKIFKLLAIIVIIIFITSCEAPESNEEERKMIINTLKENNIITIVKQIDIEKNCSWGGEVCWCKNHYIYEDQNSNIIRILYTKTDSYDKYDHSIDIEYNITRNEDFKYYDDSVKCEDGYYKYSNGDITDKSKYKHSNKNEQYYFKVEKNLFKKHYKLYRKEDL